MTESKPQHQGQRDSGFEPEFDVFLSHASEDSEWCEQFAERLRNEGVRVWFDQWQLKAGHNLHVELNKAIKSSRKMVSVWSVHYFQKEWTQVEIFSRHHGDPLSQERPIIPICLEKRDGLDIPPTLEPILSLDFTNPTDFELCFRQLLEALDLPKRESAGQAEITLLDRTLRRASPSQITDALGRRFEEELTKLYGLLGFEVPNDPGAAGDQFTFRIKKREGGITTEAVVTCYPARVTAKERDELLAQQSINQTKLPKHRWIAVSAHGFTPDARVGLEEADFDCVTYPELLRELVPLDTYVEILIAEYEIWAKDNWGGRDLFVRPNIETDITYEKRPALAHMANWLGDPRANLLVVLGDLGTGKTTLSRFLAYQLARSFRDDPLRHPAPVLIPLREVRKDVALDSIVVRHFRDRGLLGVSFPRFEHLLRQGKIVLFFDAFDEMADRVRWDVTQANFQELRRAAVAAGKVVLTCRTHYFKDRTEQVKLIGEGPSLTAAETALYKELRQQSNAEVVYLQEFNDAQILDYLRKTRGASADKDWQKIQTIYNLRDLAQRPLLLDMIVKSLPQLHEGQTLNAASLYTVYTNAWVERDHIKGRVVLTRDAKLALMMELAWLMWADEKKAFSPQEIASCVATLHATHPFDFGDEEVEDIAREVQTASFLRRERDGGEFTFMHRSFGEFFLARKILTALTAAVADSSVLNTRRFDRKVVYFLTLLDEADALRAVLQGIVTSPYRQNVSENGLQLLYWSGRIRCGMEEQIHDLEQLRQLLAERLPPGAQLAGSQLQEVVLEGATFARADFSSADLPKANLNHAEFTDTSFPKANLNEVRAEDLSCERVDFREAEMGGAVFAGARFADCDFAGTLCEPAQFATSVLQRVQGLRLPDTLQRKVLRAVVQLGSPLPVRAVAWIHDRDVLAVGADDGIIRLYRASDGRLLRTLEGHKSGVWSVAVDPQGRTLASGSQDRTVKLWEAWSGKLLRTLRGHQKTAWAVAFDPEGHTLASGSYDQTVRLWDVLSGNLLRRLEGYQVSGYGVAFDPRGRTLASSSYDQTVKLWEATTGKLLRALEGQTKVFYGVAFDSQGRTLASGSEDGTITLWDAESGELLRTLIGHEHSVYCITFDPQGRTLASGSWDHRAKLWDASTGNLVCTLEGHQNRVVSVAFDLLGRTLATGSTDNTAKLWEATSGKLLRTLPGHENTVVSVAFDPLGRRLATGGTYNTVKLWEATSGKLLGMLVGHKDTVLSVAFDAQGRTLASGSTDSTLKLWEVTTGTLLRTLQGHEGSVLSVAFNSQSQTLASGGHDHTVRLWDTESGKLLRTLDGHQGSVHCVAFDPQGHTVVGGSQDQTVKLWEVTSGRLIRTLEAHKDIVLSVAFDAHGRRLATGSVDCRAKLWEVANGELLCTLEGHQARVSSVAFDPHGRTLASGSEDHTVKLWEVESTKLLHTLEGHLGPVTAICFAPDGRYLVAAGAAGRLQFWDIEHGETFLYLYAFGPGAWLALLPDGRFDGTPEALRYLCYTERDTFNSFTAEELVKEFHAPQAVKDVLSRYSVPAAS